MVASFGGPAVEEEVSEFALHVLWQFVEGKAQAVGVDETVAAGLAVVVVGGIDVVQHIVDGGAKLRGVEVLLEGIVAADAEYAGEVVAQWALEVVVEDGRGESFLGQFGEALHDGSALRACCGVARCC